MKLQELKISAKEIIARGGGSLLVAGLWAIAAILQSTTTLVSFFK